MPTQLISSAVLIAGSQSSLAEMLGVSQPSVSKWVTGKSQPGAKTTLALENKFAISRHRLRPDIFGSDD